MHTPKTKVFLAIYVLSKIYIVIQALLIWKKKKRKSTCLKDR